MTRTLMGQPMKHGLTIVLRESLRDFRRTWTQLVLTDIIMRIVGVLILAPIVGLLLRLFLARTPTGVVADAAIATFLFQPAGIAALLIVGAVSLGLLFAESGALMVIGFAAVEDRHVTWLDGLSYAFRRVAGFVHVAWFAVVRLLMLAIPFLLGVAALYLLLLRQYDINFYLAEKPPEFWVAIVGAGALLTTLAFLIVRRIAGWLLALPLVLFEDQRGKDALRSSEEATATDRGRLTLGLLGWLVAAGLLSAAVTFVVSLLGNLVIPHDGSSIPWLLAMLSVVVVVSGLANLGVTVFATVLFPLIVVRVYRRLAGPGELSPVIAPQGSLGPRPSGRVPGKSLLAGAGAGLAVLTVVAYVVLRNVDSDEQVQIIAHRGGAAVAPENTMAAFRRGIADGADWLELDVQENADGVVVVEHDRDFMRAAGARLQVWQATSADLADLDVGSFFDPQYSDQRVPTLREVLELARGQAGVLIELKYYGHDRSLESKVVDIVEETGVESNVVIMSLEYDGVRKIAALRPQWTYGLLNTVALGDLTRLDLNFLALSAGAASFSMIRRAQRQGMQVHAWTINDPIQMTVMMSRGVNGIITDRVAMARQVLDMREQLTPLGRFVIWLAGEAGLLRGIDESSTRDDA